MNSQVTTEIIRQALLTAFWIGLPLLVVGFVIGVATSLVQIVTSMQDPAFAAVPRLAAFLAAVIILLPWMTMKMVSYTSSILGDLGDMPVSGSIQIPLGTLATFLFVLARVGGAIAFVPMPGFRTSPIVPRIVLAVMLTIALYPAWPASETLMRGDLSFWWLGPELALGVSIGAVVAWLNECFVMAMQFLSLQAGYSYASTIDPTTQADSGVLQVLSQFAAALLFFVVGVDRELFKLFGESFAILPPGAWTARPGMAEEVIQFSGSMLVVALKLALPLVAFLLLIDVALALLGRLQPQLQLLSLAFPIKMLVSMFTIGVLTSGFGSIFRGAEVTMLRTLRHLIGIGVAGG